MLKSCRYANTHLMVLGVINVRVIFQVLLDMDHELMHFVNALHEAGIGVIMDFVPVHFVKDNYALGMFDGTPLYEYSKSEDANSEWGTANFNLWKEEVRSFLCLQPISG